MTTISAPRIQQNTPTSQDSLSHGVHVACQEDAPSVTAICGTQLAWEDQADLITELCVVCRDLLVCPVCGAQLKMPA